MPDSDYIVIGAGLAGAATAWHLADRGYQVEVLERTTPGNEEGSSHGSARILRYAYPDHFYSELVQRAKLGWDELERRSGQQLFTPTGALDHGESREPRQLASVLDTLNIEHELFSARAAHERWPQFRFETEVLWHPDAGVLNSVRAVETMLALAEATGNALVSTHWNVSKISRAAGGGFTVSSTSGETATSRSVVVAAGGWLPHMLAALALPAGFLARFPRLEVRQEQALHLPWHGTDAQGVTYPDWPTFIHKQATLQTYGLPGGLDAGFRGQKVAQFNGGRVLSSALERDGRIQSEMRQKLIDYAIEYLPGVVPEPYAETTCLFTNTTNEDFIIDTADGVTILSACSGHGGKFAPLLGELAAAVATGESTPLERFTVSSHTKGGAQ